MIRIGRAFASGLVAAGLAFGQGAMSVDQLRAFIQSSTRLRHPDKQVAEYLKNIKLSEQLTAGAVEDLQAEGAGPRTTEALKKLMTASASLPAAAPPPPPKVIATIAPATSEEQAQALHDAREYAMDYSRRLPNFICTQVTRRYLDPSGLEFWQRQDVITAKLSYFEQREDYKVVLVNNQIVDTTPERIGGATSSGEFGSMLKELFAPETNAKFEWERWATLRGRRAHVFTYTVAKDRSKWRISYERSQEVTAAYRGLLYVDRDTRAIMRMTTEAVDLPPAFPVQQAGNTLDYDFQKIGGEDFVLPLRAVVRMRSGKMLLKNEVEFRMYNRFGTESTITVTPEALTDEQLQEQPATPPPAPPSASPSQPH